MPVSNQTHLPITKTVKILVITQVVIWFFGQVLFEKRLGLPLASFLALFPAKVVLDFYIWQPLTYMFLHSPQDVLHILFNMLMLWWLGGELENRWGAKFFLTYYLVSGVGAAVLYIAAVFIYSLVSGSMEPLMIPVVGASGAIFGLMCAYGILFGERTIYFMMLFPMKARQFVMLLGGIQIVSLVASGVQGGEVAYLAHLGGLISGYLFLLIRSKMQAGLQKKKRTLKLVVDNDKPQSERPKYWN